MESFRVPKAALINCSNLNNPDDTGKFYLWTNSGKGSTDKEGNTIAGMIRWAHSQISPDDHHFPISSGSRCLTKHEKGHSVSILEKLAVIEGLKDNYYKIAKLSLTIYCYNMPLVTKGSAARGLNIAALDAFLSQSGQNLSNLKDNSIF